MTRRDQPALPATSFGLLLVEGGDERAICQALTGSAWASLCCRIAYGRDLPTQARLARLDPNFSHARSVGVVLDVEHDVDGARRLASDTLIALGAATTLVHGELAGEPRMGAFLSPDAFGALKAFLLAL